ncbi:MAG: phage tail sheath C-terminal domain-containing protein, partial [Thermoprotei archaeon]
NLNNVLSLSNGSDGSLIDPTTGIVVSDVAQSLLELAYQGNIDPNVLNTDFYPIDLVLDAGYPLGVKQAIVTLASELRMDCFALLDLGVNGSSAQAVTNRIQNENFNTFYAAIYDPYIQISDQFTGKSIWLTPIYVVSQLFALNDKINDVWYAVAGYTRGAINNVTGLLYQPDLTSYYQNQINPIINTSSGNVLWGQLTTQRAANSMQNVNVVRMVLYVQRAIKNMGKYYIFDLNDQITWTNIQTSINNFLTSVQSERGLQDFSVQISATQYQLNNKQVTVSVTLKPTLALEQILVPIYVQ